MPALAIVNTVLQSYHQNKLRKSKKKVKGMKIGKEMKWFVLIIDVIVQVENLKESTNELESSEVCYFYMQLIIGK